MIKKLLLSPGFLLVLCLLSQPSLVLAQTVSEAEAAKKEITSLVIEGVKLEAKSDYAAALPMLQQALALAEKTVRNYVSNLLAKLGMHRRSEAAAFAARLDERGELTPPP